MSHKYAELTARNVLRNRTIVSDDVEELLIDISSTLGLELKLHRYKTGTDIGSWVVPPSWNVNEAWIKDQNGRVIASYDQHPLFLAPYCKEFSGFVNLNTLKNHTSVHPTQKTPSSMSIVLLMISKNGYLTGKYLFRQKP